MAILRTYDDVLKFGPNAAEEQLIEACKAGERCWLGADVPDGPSDTRTIRADILRYLLLGGCNTCEVDGRGVWLVGGYISGYLNLDFATTRGATYLQNCHFQNRFDSAQTRFKVVDLSGSTLNGWYAQGAEVEGSVFLRDITANAAVDLTSATIGGHLACEKAKFNCDAEAALVVAGAKVEGGIALKNIVSNQTINLNSASIGGQLDFTGAQLNTDTAYAVIASDSKVAGGVFLHPRVQDQKDEVEIPFHSTGELRFNGAILGGFYGQDVTMIATSSRQSLSLGGATINGAVRLDGCNSTGEVLLAGSRISGRVTCEKATFHNEKGHAFNGKSMRVDHAFVWKKVTRKTGALSLNGAHVAELDDDPKYRDDSSEMFLDGFTYDRIRGKVSNSADRMAWLQRGSYLDGEFRPQPYSQFAKFLRDTGHDEDARSVLYTRERLRRASARAQRRASGHSFAAPLNLWFTVWDILLRVVVGYGHHPFRSVAALAVLICLTIVPAHYAWEEGSFAPNAAPLLVSQNWAALAATEPQPGAVWAGDRLPEGAGTMTLPEWKTIAPGRDWETFNRYAYGFDVVIPIIAFGQTDAWAPSTTRGPWGYHLWWARWVFTVMGWIVTALGAAAITGIIRQD